MPKNKLKKVYTLIIVKKTRCKPGQMQSHIGFGVSGLHLKLKTQDFTGFLKKLFGVRTVYISDTKSFYFVTG